MHILMVLKTKVSMVLATIKKETKQSAVLWRQSHVLCRKCALIARERNSEGRSRPPYFCKALVWAQASAPFAIKSYVFLFLNPQPTSTTLTLKTKEKGLIFRPHARFYNFMLNQFKTLLKSCKKFSLLPFLFEKCSFAALLTYPVSNTVMKVLEELECCLRRGNYAHHHAYLAISDNNF